MKTYRVTYSLGPPTLIDAKNEIELMKILEEDGAMVLTYKEVKDVVRGKRKESK